MFAPITTAAEAVEEERVVGVREGERRGLGVFSIEGRMDIE